MFLVNLKQSIFLDFSSFLPNPFKYSDSRSEVCTIHQYGPSIHRPTPQVPRPGPRKPRGNQNEESTIRFFSDFLSCKSDKSAEMSKISPIVQYFSRGSAFVKDFVFYNFNQTTMTGINMCYCFLKVDKNCMKKMVLRLLSFNLLMASTVFIFEIVSTCFTAPCLGRRIMLG